MLTTSLLKDAAAFTTLCKTEELGSRGVVIVGCCTDKGIKGEGL